MSQMDREEAKKIEKEIDQHYRSFIRARRLTPLRRFVLFVGQDPSEKSRKQLDKISKTSRYKQWLILRKLKKMADNLRKTDPNLQNEDVSYQRPSDLPQPRKKGLDAHDLERRRHHPYVTHTQKQRRIKTAIMSLINRGKGDVHHTPGHVMSVNPKAVHGFLAMRKGRTMVQKQVGHKPQRTFYTDDVNIYEEDHLISPKTQKVLRKSREIKLRTNTIEVNPPINPDSNDKGEKI